MDSPQTPNVEPASLTPQPKAPEAGLPPALPVRPAREQRTSLRRRMMLGAAGLAGVAAITRLARAGVLSPPPGPIQPTGSSLSELSKQLSLTQGTLDLQAQALAAKIALTPQGIAEPRTPIESLPSSAEAQFVISKPGAYCLTRNLLQAQGTVCIDIQSDHVDIDGQGFVFDGGGGGGGGGGGFSSCIRSSGHQAIEIYDCAFRGWQGTCCDLQDCDDVHLSDILFHECVSPPDAVTGTDGAVVRCHDRAVIEDVVFSRCTGRAAYLNFTCEFTDSRVSFHTGDGVVCGDNCCIEDSSFLQVSGGALMVGGSCTISSCELRLCGALAISTGGACVVECCELVDCAGGGIHCADASCVEDCSLLRVTGDVIVTGSACCVCSCDIGYCNGQAVSTGSSSSVECCDISFGLGGGIRCADSSCVEDCSVYGRDALAIECSSRCSVSSNHVVLCWGISVGPECSVCDNDLSSCSGGTDNLQRLGGAIVIHGDLCVCDGNFIASSRVGISVQLDGSRCQVHDNSITGVGMGADPASGPSAGIVFHDAAVQCVCTCNCVTGFAPGTAPYVMGTAAHGPIAVLASGDISANPSSSHPLANTAS